MISGSRETNPSSRELVPMTPRQVVLVSRNQFPVPGSCFSSWESFPGFPGPVGQVALVLIRHAPTRKR